MRFGKSRFVPIASDLAQRLRVYREIVTVRIARRDYLMLALLYDTGAGVRSDME